MRKRGQRTTRKIQFSPSTNHAGLKDQTHVIRLSDNHLYLLSHHRSLSASLIVIHHKYKHKETHMPHTPIPHQGASFTHLWSLC